jgi:hypothetical protein
MTGFLDQFDAQGNAFPAGSETLRKNERKDRKFRFTGPVVFTCLF